MSQWFELVVFTASMEIYGTAVADKLDGNQGMLNRRCCSYKIAWIRPSIVYTDPIDWTAPCALVQVLPAALHAGLWILHQGLVSDLRRPLLRIHSGQLTGRIQGLPRYKPQKTILTNFYLICECSDNAIPIKSWFNDPSDTALLNLLPVLDALRFSALQ